MIGCMVWYGLVWYGDGVRSGFLTPGEKGGSAVFGVFYFLSYEGLGVEMR